MFISSHNRIKLFRENHKSIEVYNLNFYDGKVLGFFKKINKLKIIKPIKGFELEGVYYQELNIRRGIFSFCAERLNKHYHLCFFYALSVKRKFKNADLICAHWGHYPGLLSLWLKKILGIRNVVTYHGSDIHTHPVNNSGMKTAVQKVLAQSDGNVFVSNDLYIQALKLGMVTNPKIIRNGIDIEIYKRISEMAIDSIKKENNLKGKIIGFVGNLVEVKNAQLLPAIFKEITCQLNEICSFLIVGDGELRKQIEKETTDLMLNTFFTGDIPSKEVGNYMSCMDLMILPSKHEGYPLVLTEALSCGCSCIGSRTGGIPEIIGFENTVDINVNEEFFIIDLAVLAVRKLKDPHYLSRAAPTSEFSLWEDVFLQEIEFYNSIV